MIEVHPNLFVGAEHDEHRVRGQTGWYVIHACKEPYLRAELSYRTPGAPKAHPEYLITRRPDRLILNLVDAPDVRFIPPEIIDEAVAAIAAEVATRKVLVHCNEGRSRSPTIALLYLAKHTSVFSGMSLDGALAAFAALYPPFAPARGVSDYVRTNWTRYAAVAA